MEKEKKKEDKWDKFTTPNILTNKLAQKCSLKIIWKIEALLQFSNTYIYLDLLIHMYKPLTITKKTLN